MEFPAPQYLRQQIARKKMFIRCHYECNQCRPCRILWHGGVRMLRNSNLYRRLWYVKKRNLKRINLLLRFAIAAIIIYFIITVYQCVNIPDLSGIFTAFGL